MPMNENEIRKELSKVETQFVTDVVTAILYLNKNGIKLDVVRQMIEMKVHLAFNEYEMMCEEFDDILSNFRHYHQRKI